jgi:heavy-metal-associated domain-containing protein
MTMKWKKQAVMAAFVGVLFTAAPTFGQAKPETTKQDRANVSLRFAKEGTVSASCSQTLGLITQGMLQLEGVKNVRIDAKNNGVRVSYDPSKTTPEKIVVAFNKENPDTLLEMQDTKGKK